MNRKTFLIIAAFIATVVGGLALLAPDVLLGPAMKATVANPAALVMARTSGVLLLAIGLLAFLVRNHGDSPTLAAVFKANLFLQLAILPIDPLAYYYGIFGSLGAFVPNLCVHSLLAVGFAYYLVKMRRHAAQPSASSLAGAH